MQSSLRAVLWDMDGTLVDSKDYHWLAWQRTMAAEGLQISYEQFAVTFGRQNRSFLPAWLGLPPGHERVQQISDRKEDTLLEIIREKGISALPGAAEWVRRLLEEGWLQAIASSAPRRNVEAVIEVLGLRRYFHAIVAAEDVPVSKPDPQVFLTAAARLGVPPSRCVVVEDAVAGVEAARRAAMPCIAVQAAGEPLNCAWRTPSLDQLPPGIFERLLAEGLPHNK